MEDISILRSKLSTVETRRTTFQLGACSARSESTLQVDK